MYDILGIGTPMLDLIIKVSHDFLLSLPGEKGGMRLISYQELENLLIHADQKPLVRTGGSAANTIKGLAKIGQRCAFLGKIGSDQAGELFTQALLDMQVTPLLSKGLAATGQVVCLVSMDSERTFYSFQGAGKELQVEDLNPEMFKGIRLLHIEGYTLLLNAFTEAAMKMAKKSGALISFDLASFEITSRYKKKIIDLLVNYVDILFANMPETLALTRLSEPEKGCEILKDLCETAVVMMGSKGCWAARGNEKAYFPAYSVVAKDTTGAGDFFASGFLHAFLEEKPIEECARIGSLIASEVVQVHGTDIPEERWLKIRTSLSLRPLA